MTTPESALHIGIDLGGTKIEMVALDGGGRQRYRERVATPAAHYDQIVSAIVQLVNRAEERLGARATVGVGTPGTISPATGLIKNSNTLSLIGRPLDRDLQDALSRPVRVANDADCFTLSEATDGAAAGAGVVFGVILGTGTGGGIVVNDRLIKGPNSITGEWGHNPLPWPGDDERPGPDCYCGLRGCIETFLSGPGLSRDHELATGCRLPGPEIARRADQGDEPARATLARYENRLARSLASVINVLDPNTIVLGGGLSNMERLYSTIPALWHSHVFSDRVDTRLVRAFHGDASGVRGAAWVGAAPQSGTAPGWAGI